VTTPFRVWLFAAAFLIVSGHARAEDGSVPGPDGTAITRENYPTEITNRPLVPPPGMINASVGVSYVNLLNLQKPALGASFSYSFFRGFELGVEGEGLYSPDVELFASYLLARNAAVRLWGEYNFADGTNENESNVGFGVGVPLKFKLPGAPVAIGGLDNVFEADFPHWPGQTLSLPDVPSTFQIHLNAANGVETWFRLPVWIEVSPLRVLSIEAGGEMNLLLSNHIEPNAGAVVVVNPAYHGFGKVFGEVFVTVRHVDIGAEVEGRFPIYDASQVSGSAIFALPPPKPQAWGNFFVAVRF
jgi:hypothetical protein